MVPLADPLKLGSPENNIIWPFSTRSLVKYADITIFDASIVIDKATFEDPHQYAEGIYTVLVNGVIVVDDGAHNGNKPSRVFRGPGYKY